MFYRLACLDCHVVGFIRRNNWHSQRFIILKKEVIKSVSLTATRITSLIKQNIYFRESVINGNRRNYFSDKKATNELILLLYN